MTDSELFGLFYVGLGIAAVLVLVAAGLLIAVWMVARSILGHAAEALEAAEKIAADTQIIWELEETNRVAGEILMGAESIEEHGAQIVKAVSEPQIIRGG
ncbi:MAG: hypothetical protein K5924_08395 [Chloroflexi bacterium]|nr:hypothetical protein [Chloroflexota bacterium]